MLKAFRQIRNCIHNNGVHFSRDGTDETVTWKGMRFEFRHRKPLKFLGWDTLTTIFDGTVDMLEAILTDSEILKHQQLIVDSSVTSPGVP